MPGSLWHPVFGSPILCGGKSANAPCLLGSLWVQPIFDHTRGFSFRVHVASGAARQRRIREGGLCLQGGAQGRRTKIGRRVPKGRGFQLGVASWRLEAPQMAGFSFWLSVETIKQGLKLPITEGGWLKQMTRFPLFLPGARLFAFSWKVKGGFASERGNLTIGKKRFNLCQVTYSQLEAYSLTLKSTANWVLSISKLGLREFQAMQRVRLSAAAAFSHHLAVPQCHESQLHTA